MTRLSVVDLGKTFGDVVAIDGVSFEIDSGQLVCLVGPSGCGKSTTLFCVAGLEEPSWGRIYFEDQEVTNLEPRLRDVAMVFQDYALYPHMSVASNVGFPLKMSGTRRAEREKRVNHVLEALDLAGLGSRWPSELSGGQRQRVALARAIARQPSAFLMDEPLSNLDAALRVAARHEIKRIQRQLGVTTIFVTHDQEEALSLSDRLAVMGQGRVQQYGTPEEVYDRPVNAFVASFIGSPTMNMFSGAMRVGADLVQCEGVGWGLSFPTGFRPGTDVLESDGAVPVILGVRPHDFELVGEKDELAEGRLVLKGKVTITESVGPHVYITLETESGEIQTAVPARERPAVGDNVRVSAHPGHLHVFAKESGARLY
ncbi:MAG: ATP-binding cassette domain-containing protein [Actinobacteria bacterium]|nr:ATP-binding cassette domain-containing protein [Actinomycetota bacterium]